MGYFKFYVMLYFQEFRFSASVVTVAPVETRRRHTGVSVDRVMKGPTAKLKSTNVPLHHVAMVPRATTLSAATSANVLRALKAETVSATSTNARGRRADTAQRVTIWSTDFTVRALLARPECCARRTSTTVILGRA